MTTLILSPTQSADDVDQPEGAATATLGSTPDALSYTAGNTPPGSIIGLRFENVTIPPGATISAATISLYSTGGTKYPTMASVVSAVAAANAPAFTTATLVGTATLAPTATWDATMAATAYNASPSLVSLVTAQIGQAGWAVGNALAYLVTAQSGASALWAAFSNGSDLEELSITYTAGGAVLPGTAAMGGTASLAPHGTVVLRGVAGPGAGATATARGGLVLHGAGHTGATGTLAAAGKVTLSGTAGPAAVATMRASGAAPTTRPGAVAVADTPRFVATVGDTARFSVLTSDSARWGLAIGDIL